MSSELLHSLWVATGETLYMTSVAAVLVLLAGLPLGVLLVITDRGGDGPASRFERAST